MARKKESGKKPLKNARHERYARARAAGKTKTAAARLAGGPRDTANRYGYKLEQREEVRRRIEHLLDKEMSPKRAGQHLFLMIEGVIPTKELPNGKPLFERLRALSLYHKVRMGNRRIHEHSGPGGGPIPVLDLSKLSDAELMRLEKASALYHEILERQSKDAAASSPAEA